MKQQRHLKHEVMALLGGLVTRRERDSDGEGDKSYLSREHQQDQDYLTGGRDLRRETLAEAHGRQARNHLEGDGAEGGAAGSTA